MVHAKVAAPKPLIFNDLQLGTLFAKEGFCKCLRDNDLQQKIITP